MAAFRPWMLLDASATKAKRASIVFTNGSHSCLAQAVHHSAMNLLQAEASVGADQILRSNLFDLIIGHTCFDTLPFQQPHAA